MVESLRPKAWFALGHAASGDVPGIFPVRSHFMIHYEMTSPLKARLPMNSTPVTAVLCRLLFDCKLIDNLGGSIDLLCHFLRQAHLGGVVDLS